MAYAMKIAQVFVERHPFQQFHDDIGTIFNHIKINDLDDIGVAKSGDGLCLVTKSASKIRIAGLVRMKDLTANRVIRSLLTSNVNVAHASGPNEFPDPHLEKTAPDHFSNS